MITIVLLASILAEDAMSTARAQMAVKDCHGAIRTLQTAIPDAVATADQKRRDEAMAAIHFYSALAFNDCAMPEKAREQLREFFRFRHGRSSLNPAKFPAPFIKLFDDVQRSLDGATIFNGFYPGFNEYGDFIERPLPIAIWGTSPAFQLLADEGERSEWNRLRDDVARDDFISRFWRRRDADPITEPNEFRAAIERRVEFADRQFLTPEEVRGSMTDRGRVFILLGTPARVHRQALRRDETTIVRQRARAPLTGNMERWVYFRPQLPSGVVAHQVEFRFITQPGYGDYVLQKDFWPIKALAEARKNTQPKPE